MSATPQSGNSTLRLMFLGLAFIVFLIIINSIINSCKRNNSEGDKDTTEDCSNSSSSDNVKPFTTHVTPCEWTENEGFYLESDDPIAQKFPGISQTIIYCGKGKSEVPYGRRKGPIEFYDPSDPTNGRKEFRIYPVK